ncbi:MAG: extracellular solute-binding protein [Lachnospiraceae bacterium]|nr:extracellular solute-binding protein [Lachnospiraceae bacterium]
MKKKVLATLLTAAMLATTLVGCGGGASEGGVAPADDGAATEAPAADGGSDDGAADDGAEAPADEAAAEEEIPTSTFGDPNGTHLEMWTFVEIHGQHYGNMVDIWNEQNPDRPIEITCTTYPYPDMHTKLLTSLTAGTGAPDICDVELGQFPNVVAGLDTWLLPLDDYAAPYMATMVKARMDTYAGSDGHYYGAPYHVGAFVMYYNVAAMSEAMGISQDEVISKIDSVVTWDDYAALGKEYVDAIATEGKYWTSVDTAGVDWQWIAMAEHGDDWTGGFDNPANVQLDSVKKMCTMEQQWLNDGIAQVSPDGHVDLEAGFQNILDHNIVSFPKAMWYMSRFTNYMPEEKGNWYIAKCPVFQAGQPCSVGVGGTGTVVSQQSANKELAAEFLCWAKMSEEGEQLIWDNLGFDVCNTVLWNDDAFAHDDSNQYNAFFINYPYDVLYSIKDEIGKISCVAISPIINEQMCNVTLNDMFENGVDVDEALQAAQDVIDLEQ